MKTTTSLNLTARLLAGFLLSITAAVAQAQDTNEPRTELGAFESRTGIVIVKSTDDIGSVTNATGNVSIKCRESLDTSSGLKQQGLAITITGKDQQTETALIDYDELDSLLSALDYLTTVNWSVTTLGSFDAVYMSRDGLRASVYGNQRRLNDLGISLQINRAVKVRISFTADQLVQFRAFIQQAKAKLDVLRGAK